MILALGEHTGGGACCAHCWVGLSVVCIFTCCDHDLFFLPLNSSRQVQLRACDVCMCVLRKQAHARRGLLGFASSVRAEAPIRAVPSDLHLFWWSNTPMPEIFCIPQHIVVSGRWTRLPVAPVLYAPCNCNHGIVRTGPVARFVASTTSRKQLRETPGAHVLGRT
jgi:hypothetical protein